MCIPIQLMDKWLFMDFLTFSPRLNIGGELIVFHMNEIDSHINFDELTPSIQKLCKTAFYVWSKNSRIRYQLFGGQHFGGGRLNLTYAPL